LIDEYGREKMFDMLNTFQQGAGYDEALVKVYGFDMDGLHELWLDYYYPDMVDEVDTATQATVMPVNGDSSNTVLWLLGGFLGGVIIVLALFLGRQVWHRRN
jgi:hypothetical protein